MKWREAGPWRTPAVAVVLLGLFAIGAWSPSLPLLSLVEDLLSDLRVAAASPVSAGHPGIVLVTITEATLEKTRRRSPIDREFLAILLLQLATLQPAAIGVDILIDQESEKDDKLQDVLAQLDVPVRFAYADLSLGPDHVRPWQHKFQEEFFGKVSKNPMVGRARIDFWEDHDGVVRRLPSEKNEMPSLAGELARLAGIASPLPTGRLDYLRGTDAFLKLTPEQVKMGLEFLRKPIAGRMVLVGADLPDVDRHRTPFSTFSGMGEAGVRVHAQALAQYLDGRSRPEPPSWVRAAASAAVVAAGFALGLLRSRTWILAVTGVLMMVALWALAFAAYARPGGPLLPLAGPTLAWTGALLLGMAVSRRDVREQRNFVRKALRKYVPPEIARALEADPGQLEIRGEKREIVAIFSDIAGFTTLSESLEPFTTARLLNRYLEGMTRIVHEHGGTLDKYIGDAVVALWGAPLPSENAAARAIACAIAMNRFGDTFADECAAAGVEFGHTRIGVHGGFAIVGNFGGEERFQYTAIGDTMNTASRLEGANKYFGTRILVSAEVAEASGRADLRPVAAIVVKGRQRPIEVFTPAPPFDAAPLAQYTEAYRMMAAGDSAAFGAFEALAVGWPDDPVVHYHAARARRGERTVASTLEGK